jgi:hypothetical protein
MEEKQPWITLGCFDKVFRKRTLESLDPLLQLNWRKTIIINIIFLEIAQDLGYQKFIYSSLSSTGIIFKTF